VLLKEGVLCCLVPIAKCLAHLCTVPCCPPPCPQPLTQWPPAGDPHAVRCARGKGGRRVVTVLSSQRPEERRAPRTLSTNNCPRTSPGTCQLIEHGVRLEPLFRTSNRHQLASNCRGMGVGGVQGADEETLVCHVHICTPICCFREPSVHVIVYATLSLPCPPPIAPSG